MKLATEKIHTDGGTQARARIDDATVAEYAEAIGDGAQFPAIVVFFDGSDYWLADGFHRLAAMKRLGCLEIDADIRQGTRDDAIDFSCSSAPNSRHGLREKPEDRRRRVDTMLRRKIGWSNRQIAEWCGVDEKTVRTVKAAGMERVGRPTAENPQSTVRGRDGRTINTENIGKTRPTPESEPLDPLTDEDKVEEAAEFTSVEKGLRDTIDYIEITMDELDPTAKAAYITALLKHVKGLALQAQRGEL